MKTQLLLSIAALMASAPIHAGIGDLVRGFIKKQEVVTSVLPPTVRVLLMHDQSEVVIEVKGKYTIYDPKTKKPVTASFIPKRRLIEAHPAGLRWGEEFPGIHQLVIVPDDSNTTIIVDSKEYKGPIYVYDVDGTISIVNQVDLEEFLLATLGNTFYGLQTEEMLAAIAIVARTNCYYNCLNSKTPYWNVDAEAAGYQGYALSGRNVAMEKAVRSTKHMVVNKRDGNIAPFALEWRPEPGGKLFKSKVYATMTFEEAAALANQGKNACGILEQAFPGATISLEPAI